MALQTTGPISLSDIQTEFGGTNPIALTDYYGAAAGVPTEGQIALTDFYGKSAIMYFWNSGSTGYTITTDEAGTNEYVTFGTTYITMSASAWLGNNSGRPTIAVNTSAVNFSGKSNIKVRAQWSAASSTPFIVQMLGKHDNTEFSVLSILDLKTDIPQNTDFTFTMPVLPGGDYVNIQLSVGDNSSSSRAAELRIQEIWAEE